MIVLTSLGDKLSYFYDDGADSRLRLGTLSVQTGTTGSPDMTSALHTVLIRRLLLLSTETTVKTTVNLAMEMRKIFQRLNSVEKCTLCDTSQKDLVHESGEFRLQAITLKGGNSERKGTRW